MRTYTIKKLEWEGEVKELYDSAYASTPFGSYYIGINDHGFYWGYYFDEYYDEEQYCCYSIHEGKKEAEKHWVNRLSEALVEQ